MSIEIEAELKEGESFDEVVYLSGSFPNVIPSKDIEGDWRESFSDSRVNISIATPLIAYKMFQIVYYWVDDPRIKTAAAMVQDGTNYIFINPKFWMKGLHNTEQRAFVLVHEILHIYLEHCGRQEEKAYDPELWNIAADYNINLTGSGAYLTDDGKVAYGRRYQLYLERPKFALYDERFIGMSSDDIYHLLLEEAGGNAKKAVENATGGKHADENGGPSDGQQVPLDQISGNVSSSKDKAKNRQAAAAAAASTSAAKLIGENEGGLLRTLADLNRPVVDWRDELNEIVQSSTKERYTYNRLSRREGDGGVVFPSMVGKKINVVFGFDSSGSMGTDDYRDVAGELSGILDQFEAWELCLVSCDTVAFELGTYASDDSDDISTINFDHSGGGGTDMTPLAKYANNLVDQGEEINACIIVTDGHIPADSLDREFIDDIKNIVVVTRGGNHSLHLENAKVIQMHQEG